MSMACCGLIVNLVRQKLGTFILFRNILVVLSNIYKAKHLRVCALRWSKGISLYKTPALLDELDYYAPDTYDKITTWLPNDNQYLVRWYCPRDIVISVTAAQLTHATQHRNDKWVKRKLHKNNNNYPSMPFCKSLSKKRPLARQLLSKIPPNLQFKIRITRKLHFQSHFVPLKML